MNTWVKSEAAYLENHRPWYEGPHGTCNLLKPTLIHMGDDKPLHLMFPVHWTEAIDALPQAKIMARQLDGFLVLLLYGQASDQEIQSLVLELAESQVLPLWLGWQNRKRFDRIVAMLSNHSELN
ncbi:MAG: hypothetical protein F6K65_32200 [Moorea sp. SIO3C2]|nr:hypothetical protein [Moorena sp. SIO3C2]